MNKTINTVVELTEKELASVTGGGIVVGGEERLGKKRPPYVLPKW